MFQVLSASESVEHLLDPIYVPGDHLAVCPMLEVIACNEIVLTQNEALPEIPVALFTKIHGIGEIVHASQMLNKDDCSIEALD